MAHTKAQKATKGNRDSISKRRGVKIFGGAKAQPGKIIVRQKGNKYFPGENVLQGKDFTLMSLKDGVVKFHQLKGKKYVSVV